jgi:hypothetical protein
VIFDANFYYPGGAFRASPGKASGKSLPLALDSLYLEATVGSLVTWWGAFLR